MATKEQKRVTIDEIKALLAENNGVYLAEYTTMNVAQVGVMRRHFRNKNLKIKVYKNKLVQQAMKEIGGYDALFQYLNQPCTYVFVKDDFNEPAKVFKAAIEEIKEKPKFKAAFIDGSVYGPNALESLTTIKSKKDVIGEIIGMLQSPMQNIVSALQAQGGNIAGAIKTIAEKNN
jgi:large subunit ribosomal protein L10